MISDQLIVRESGQYDKETLQRLRLERLGIHKISNLDNCVSLIELSLSSNEIIFITGLDNLVSLKRLDLSYNEIRRIENLSSLITLEYLDLKANQITNLGDLDELKPLFDLKTLFLRGVEGEDANPVCSNPEYSNTVTQILPQLQMIDAINEAFLMMEQQMSNVQPDRNNCTTPPLESWVESAESIIKDTNGDVNKMIYSSKHYNAVLETHNDVMNMLTEDCSHLLRKSSSLLAKIYKE